MHCFILVYLVGISKAITDHAGPKLIKEYDIYMQKHGFLDYGAVHTTPAIGFDNHKFILHVRSPTNKHNILFKATRPLPLIELIYYNILKTSFIDSSLNTIALPLIGTGTVGVPITDSCNDLTMAILKILADFKDSMRNNEYKIYVINNIPSQLDQAETSLGQQISAHSKDILPIKEEKKSSVNKLEKIDRDNECIICLDTIINEKQLTKCSHSFCTKCIDDYFEKIKKMCPVCNTSYGLPYGDQPSGIMTSQMLNMSLPGFEQSGTIQINYHIPNGIQNAKHPNPGAAYFGTTRTAYLPDTDKGRKVHELLKKAFEYKLVFTIGQSRTTGLNDVVTWNDIHHKTNINGGPQV